MNTILFLTRTRASSAAARTLRFLPARSIILTQSFATLPKRSDAEAAGSPSTRASVIRPRMPSSVVARRSPEAVPASATVPLQSSYETELRSMSVADLKRLAAARGISTAGFFDKDDFVRALQAAPPAPPSQTSHLTPVAASNLSTAEPPRPFANMPVDNPDSQIQVNENPSPDVVARGLNTLMAQPYIMIKRRMEMLNFMIGFEQNNQYTIYGASGDVVGYIVEEGQGLMGMAVRNIAHTHRPFKARVMDPQGNVIMKVFRDFFFFKSSLTVARYDGSIVGEVEQEFTVLRRKYSLFTKDSAGGNQQQFGLVNAPTLSLNFNVEDDNYNVVAAVDRDFSSFGEVISSMFIDKNSYVVHFSTLNNHLFRDRLSYLNTPDGAASFFSIDKTPEERLREPPKLNSSQQELGQSNGSRVTGGGSNSQLAERSAATHTTSPASPLTPQQKAVVLGTAISIDFDYFSRHSSSSNHGVLGGFGGMFGGFGGGGDDSSGHSTSSSESPSTSDQRSDAGSSSSSSSGGGAGYGDGSSQPPPTHGKYGEDLDPDQSDTMVDKWDVFSDDD